MLHVVAALGVAASALAAGHGAASAESNNEGAVLTHVCQVDITYKTKAGDLVTATTCIDGRFSCNDMPGGVCAPGKSRNIVSKTCSWVGLSMCHSQ